MATDDFYEIYSNQSTKLVFHLKDSEEDHRRQTVCRQASSMRRELAWHEVGFELIRRHSFMSNQKSQQFAVLFASFNDVPSCLIGIHSSSSCSPSSTTFLYVESEVATIELILHHSKTSNVPSRKQISDARHLLLHNKSIPFLSKNSIFHYHSNKRLSTSKSHCFSCPSFQMERSNSLVEDSDYGAGNVTCLTDAFQHVIICIAYKLMISLSSTTKQIMQELDVIKTMQTKVFIVHASHELASRIFVAAKEAEMMTEGYAWIVTYGMTDYLNLMDPMAIDAMQGVLSLNPYVPQSKKLDEFKANWKKFYSENKTSSLKLDHPAVFGLRAYDTVWALETAAEIVHGRQYSSFPGSNGAKLYDLLLSNTLNLSGVSGNFRFFNRSQESTAFEIVNVIGYRKKRIVFCTLTQGISKTLNYKASLTNILGPGYSIHTTKCSEKHGNRKKLRIGIPIKNGFRELVNYDWNPYTFRNGSGFCSQVFDMVMASLPYTIEYEYLPYMNGEGQIKGSYDDLIHEVYLQVSMPFSLLSCFIQNKIWLLLILDDVMEQNFDAAVGDIPITQDRSLYVDFTVRYGDLGVSMVVPIENERERNAWIFLKPLTANLWLVSGAFFIFTALGIWILEHRINKEFNGSLAKQLGTTLYFSFQPWSSHTVQ
ncbi:hypothetical protein M5K25_019485 [Dendrobium thyrsiflorum]|uniref:Receptor ligand binding region domain-containing protein n=1 Tax=Dendrobium thyrsiflorum TaxID=117978 RepID=A0ABD0ULW0_DENTH